VSPCAKHTFVTCFGLAPRGHTCDLQPLEVQANYRATEITKQPSVAMHLGRINRVKIRVHWSYFTEIHWQRNLNARYGWRTKSYLT
ncbi:hypothetical protein TorRG33x02_265740, partial [Trema orientale]